jgi:hypothetical protein
MGSISNNQVNAPVRAQSQATSRRNRNGWIGRVSTNLSTITQSGFMREGFENSSIYPSHRLDAAPVRGHLKKPL